MLKKGKMNNRREKAYQAEEIKEVKKIEEEASWFETRREKWDYKKGAESKRFSSKMEEKYSLHYPVL